MLLTLEFQVILFDFIIAFHVGYRFVLQKNEIWNYFLLLAGADLERGAPSACPSIFYRDRPPDFVWAPQEKRMHQIMQIDFENYNFSPFLMGDIPLRHPLSPKVPKFCQSLILAPPLLKNPGSAPDWCSCAWEINLIVMTQSSSAILIVVPVPGKSTLHCHDTAMVLY